MPDVSWTGRDDDDGGCAHRPAARQRPPESRGHAARRAPVDHGVVRGVPPPRERDAWHQGPARLRHVPPLMTEPRVPIARYGRSPAYLSLATHGSNWGGRRHTYLSLATHGSRRARLTGK